MSGDVPVGKYFEELELNREYVSPTRTVTEADITWFAGLTGDYTEIHVSEEVARQSVFGRRVAHGLLVLGLANGLLHRLALLEGTAFALLGVEWRFRAPVLMGDTIRVAVSVTEKRELDKPDRGFTRWAARVIKQDGTVASEGHFVRLVKRRPAEG